MSLVLLLGYIMVQVHNIAIDFFMVSALISNLVILFDIVIDLDDPFHGTWMIDQGNVLHLKQRLKSTLANIPRCVLNISPNPTPIR